MAVKFGGVVKSVAMGAAACGIAVIAPVGIPVVAAVTLGIAGSSLLIESVSDDLASKRKKPDDKQ